MIKLREIVRAEINRRLDREYCDNVRKQDIDFDSWIRLKERGLERFDMTLGGYKELESLENVTYAARYENMSIRIVPYEKIRPGFSVNSFFEDIIVFSGGELTDRAIPLLVRCFKENPNAAIAYGDEDIAKLEGGDSGNYGRTIKGSRENPYFKPDFSPNAFLDRFYFGNIFALRRNAFRDFDFNIKKAGIEGMYEGLVSYIFGQEDGYRGKKVRHIDEILVHVNNYDNAKLEIKGSLNDILPSLYRKAKRTITVVIPSRDNPELLESCIKSIHDSDPGGIVKEIRVVDNGSLDKNREKILKLSEELNFKYQYEPMDFNFSKICNIGAKDCEGDFLLFLNDDVEFTNKEAIGLMLNEGMGVYTGAVGLKLLYPDSRRIQHAGVVNTKIGPVHKLQFLDDGNEYYHGFNRYIQNVSAVTGACLLVKKEIFNEVGGFDEDLPIAFNDIDLCFKIYEAGYVNAVVNRTSAVHRESVTRGKDTDERSVKRLESERERLYEKHPDLRGKDPFYSKYLNSDCLDVNIAPASLYEIERCLEDAEGKRNAELSKFREDACVQVSVEYAGPMDRFLIKDGLDRKELLIQGFSYVLGSDNALYKMSLLLKSTESCICIPVKGRLRKDVDRAVGEGSDAGLSGFSVRIKRGYLNVGEYRVGVLAEKRFSKEKLYAFSNKYLVVK